MGLNDFVDYFGAVDVVSVAAFRFRRIPSIFTFHRLFTALSRSPQCLKVLSVYQAKSLSGLK